MRLSLFHGSRRSSYQAIPEHEAPAAERTTTIAKATFSTPIVFAVVCVGLFCVSLLLSSERTTTNDLDLSAADLRRSHNHHGGHYNRHHHVRNILEELNEAMVGKVIFRNKDDEGFAKATRVWNDVAQCLAPPSAAVLPQNEQDVSVAIPFLAKLSSENGIPFRIRSGGHALFNPDQSTISNGIVLNLAHLNVMEFDPITEVATIGPGVRVDNMLETFLRGQNYSTTIGFCPNVAEGGYIGGGGWGPSLRQHGLAIDNVLELRAVLANGTAVSASPEVNSDLFWALRGGGHGTIAVMTEFKIQLFPTLDSTPLVTGSVPWKEAPSFLFMLGEMEKKSAVARRVFFLLEGCDEVGLPIQLGYVASDPASLQKGSSHLKDLIQTLLLPVESQSITDNRLDLDVVYWTDFATAPDQYFENYLFQSWFSFLHPQDNTLDSWTRIVDAFFRVAHLDWDGDGDSKSDTNPYILIEVGLFGGATSDVNPADTAYFYRNALFNVGLYLAIPSDVDNAKKVYDELVDKINPIWSALREEGFLQGNYPNYQIQTLSSEEYPRQYWGGNLERLQSIKALYDTNNVFHHAQGIPPLS